MTDYSVEFLQKQINKRIYAGVGLVAFISFLSFISFTYKECNSYCKETFTEVSWSARFECSKDSVVEFVEGNSTHKAGVICRCKENFRPKP